MKTLLVSIACFEDTDIAKTVADIYAKAANPGRIRVVVILQSDTPELFKPHLSQAEVYVYPTSWAAGCGKARAAALRRYNGEDYFFQTDSHMRFEQDWEQLLIDELDQCPSEKPILTTLPPGFVIATGQLRPKAYNELRYFQFFRHLPLAIGVTVPLEHYVRTSVPVQVAPVAGGVLFSRGGLCKELAYDPYMFFHGEEHSTNMRLWTMGYDNFAPRFTFCYHAYRADQEGHSKVDRIMTVQKTSVLHERSVIRAQVLTGILPKEEADPLALIDLDKYGLGAQRTIAQWEERFKVSLKRQTFPPLHG